MLRSATAPTARLRQPRLPPLKSAGSWGAERGKKHRSSRLLHDLYKVPVPARLLPVNPASICFFSSSPNHITLRNGIPSAASQPLSSRAPTHDSILRPALLFPIRPSRSRASRLKIIPPSNGEAVVPHSPERSRTAPATLCQRPRLSVGSASSDRNTPTENSPRSAKIPRCGPAGLILHEQANEGKRSLEQPWQDARPEDLHHGADARPRALEHARRLRQHQPLAQAQAARQRPVSVVEHAKSKDVLRAARYAAYKIPHSPRVSPCSASLSPPTCAALFRPYSSRLMRLMRPEFPGLTHPRQSLPCHRCPRSATPVFSEAPANNPSFDSCVSCKWQ